MSGDIDQYIESAGNIPHHTMGMLPETGMLPQPGNAPIPITAVPPQGCGSHHPPSSAVQNFAQPQEQPQPQEQQCWEPQSQSGGLQTFEMLDYASFEDGMQHPGQYDEPEVQDLEVQESQAGQSVMNASTGGIPEYLQRAMTPDFDHKEASEPNECEYDCSESVDCQDQAAEEPPACSTCVGQQVESGHEIDAPRVMNRDYVLSNVSPEIQDLQSAGDELLEQMSCHVLFSATSTPDDPVGRIIYDMCWNIGNLERLGPKELALAEAALSAHQLYVTAVERKCAADAEALKRCRDHMLNLKRPDFKSTGVTKDVASIKAIEGDPELGNLQAAYVKASYMATLTQGLGDRVVQLENGLKRLIDHRSTEFKAS